MDRRARGLPPPPQAQAYMRVDVRGSDKYLECFERALGRYHALITSQARGGGGGGGARAGGGRCQHAAGAGNDPRSTAGQPARGHQRGALAPD